MVSAIHNTTQRLATEVVTGDHAFEQLRAEWDRLLDDSDQQIYFLRWAWNQLWWEYYAPPGSRLYLITCRDQQGQLLGLAPFYWRQQRTLGVPHARELLLLGMGIHIKTSEYLDIIAKRGAEAEVAQAIAACLQQRSDWDRLWLWEVPADSTVLPHFTRAMGARARTEVCDRAPYIDTSVDWETFKRGFGRSMRRNVEYYSRRLFKTHECEFRRVTDAAELDPAMDALVRLHQARWESQGEPGSFRLPRFEAFLREALRFSLADGRLRLWTLKVDGNIEAVLVGFLDNGVMHYFQKGFNPAYAKEDLGTAMLALCVRDCFDDPAVRAFDFMGGGATYKDMWARVARENMVCEVTRPNLRAWIFTAQGQLTEAAGAVFRALTPAKLRAARREWQRRLKLRRTPPPPSQPTEPLKPADSANTTNKTGLPSGQAENVAAPL